MAGAKTTMADVAAAAGVSLATVDRVLNGRGGVSEAKERAILAAARTLKLDRALDVRPSRTLSVAVLIQPPANPFHAALREGLDMAARLHADLNIRLLVHDIDPNDPVGTARRIAAQAEAADGLVVTTPDTPETADALRRAAARLPVVTLATDVAASGRAAYVGPDDRRAGRVAGDLMGRLLGPAGGRVAMIAGHAGNRGQAAREAGFREVAAAFHPGLLLGPVLHCGEDGERAGTLALEALAADPGLAGLYHASAGAGPVAEAVDRLGRRGRVVVVSHELTPDRRALLRRRALDAVIDQDPALEARLAVECMARLLGRLGGAAETTITEFRIFTPESV